MFVLFWQNHSKTKLIYRKLNGTEGLYGLQRINAILGTFKQTEKHRLPPALVCITVYYSKTPDSATSVLWLWKSYISPSPNSLKAPVHSSTLTLRPAQTVGLNIWHECEKYILVQIMPIPQYEFQRFFNDIISCKRNRCKKYRTE